MPVSRRSVLSAAGIGAAATVLASPAAAGTGPGQFRAGSGTRIVWWGSTTGPVAFAATVLADRLHRMTGRRLPVVRVDGDGYGLGLAADPSAARAAVAAGGLDGAPADSHAVVVTGDAIGLAGVGERACLYAGYELLRRLGARFFAPEFGCYQGSAYQLPRGIELRLPVGTARHRPTWSLRRKYVEEGWSVTADGLRALIDWMATQRLNILVYPYDYQADGVTRYDDMRSVVAPELARRGMVLEVGGHGYQSFLPPDRYPQYYTSGRSVFDVDNDEAVARYVDNVLDYLASRPEIGIFDAWPPDGASWPPAAVSRFGTVSNAEAHVVNTLAAAARRRLPGVRIERIAYGAAVDPPTDGHAFDPDVIVDVAAYGRSYAVPIDDTANRGYATTLRAWRSAHAGPLAVYDYSRRYRWRELPANPLPVLAADAAWYRQLGVDGIGCYAEPATWVVAEPVHLFAAESAWDPTLSAADFRDRYLPDRYGPAAAALGEYLTHTAADPDGIGTAGQAVRFRAAYQEAGRDLRRAAVALPARHPAVPVVATLTDTVELALADVQISVRDQAGDADGAATAAARYRDLTLRYRFTGGQLESSYSASRYGGEVTRAGIAAMYRSPAWGYVRPAALTAAPGTEVGCAVVAQDVDYAGHVVTWRAEPPDGCTVRPDHGSLAPTGPRQPSARLTVAVPDGHAAGTVTLTVTFALDGRVLTRVPVPIDVR